MKIGINLIPFSSVQGIEIFSKNIISNLLKLKKDEIGKNKKMKIAMIQPSLIAPTGGKRLILRLAIELQKFGHKVEIFVNSVDKNRCFPEMIKKVKINVIPYPLPYG